MICRILFLFRWSYSSMSFQAYHISDRGSVFSQHISKVRQSLSGLEKSLARQMVWHLAWHDPLSRICFFTLSFPPVLWRETELQIKMVRGHQRERRQRERQCTDRLRSYSPVAWSVHLVAEVVEQDFLAYRGSVVLNFKALWLVQVGWTSRFHQNGNLRNKYFS